MFCFLWFAATKRFDSNDYSRCRRLGFYCWRRLSIPCDQIVLTAFVDAHSLERPREWVSLCGCCSPTLRTRFTASLGLRRAYRLIRVKLVKVSEALPRIRYDDVLLTRASVRVSRWQRQFGVRVDSVAHTATASFVSGSIPSLAGSQSVSCFSMLHARTAIFLASAIAAFFFRVDWPPAMRS